MCISKQSHALSKVIECFVIVFVMTCNSYGGDSMYFKLSHFKTSKITKKKHNFIHSENICLFNKEVVLFFLSEFTTSLLLELLL